MMNYVVVVDTDGLFPRPGSTTKYWLGPHGQTWPDVYFQRDFPLLLVTYFQHKTSNASRSIWDEVNRSASDLVEKLDTLHDIENSSILFLCHGLGAFVALHSKALWLLEPNRFKFKCSKSNTALVFFGTPLVYQNQSQFKKLLRKCATLELGLSDKAEKPSKEELEILANVVKYAEKGEFPIICVYEERRRSLSASSFLSSKYIVEQQHMKIKEAEYVPVEQDHLNSTSWNATVYNHVSALLKRQIRLPVTNISTVPI